MKRSHVTFAAAVCVFAGIVAWSALKGGATPASDPASAAHPLDIVRVADPPPLPGSSTSHESRLETVDGMPDTDGLGAAAFIKGLAPQARQGDVVAAMRLYRVEAQCSVVERNAKSLVAQTVEERRTAEASTWGAATADWVTKGRAFCEGVTPAQIRERLAFLDQGVRAGLPEALIDYRREGPDGLDIGSLDPADPRLIAWKQNANAYLRTLADQGNYLAWSVLSLDYQLGLVVPQDLRASILYQTAMTAARDPSRDPLSLDVVAAMARQLPPDDVQQAIRDGTALGRRYPLPPLAKG